MSDIPPDTNAMVTGLIYAAAGLLIAWAAKVLGFFGGRQLDRVKAVEDKQSATESRVNVLEATVVKDKEMRQALSSLRRDVDNKLEAMNGSILGATDKFLTEHRQTRTEVKQDIDDYRKENKELTRVLTELYKSPRDDK